MVIRADYCMLNQKPYNLETFSFSAENVQEMLKRIIDAIEKLKDN